MRTAALTSILALALVYMPASEATGSCPSLFDFYSHSTDCTKFYRCFWGSPIEFVCPSGTHWNQHILTCDHAYNVPCISAVNPVYSWGKGDGYGYAQKDYGSVVTKTKDYAYNKANDYPNYLKNYYNYFRGRDYNRNYGQRSDYNSGYGNQGDYKYNQFWGTGYTKHTQTPTIGHNYGRFQANGGYNQYGNNEYARTGQVTVAHPTYGGYSAEGYGSQAASGYARAGDPVVGRVFGQPASKNYGTKSHYPWKK